MLPERILTEAEVHRMVERTGNERDRVLLLTIYAGGLRREDACRMKWRDLKQREDGSGQITAFGKGGKTGFVLLPPSVLEEIRALRRRKDGAPSTARTNPSSPAARKTPPAAATSTPPRSIG